MLRSHAHPFTWQRDPRSGNHLLSYCATSEPLQTVHITPSTDVRLDFHFPPTVKLAQRVRVLAWVEVRLRDVSYQSQGF